MARSSEDVVRGVGMNGMVKRALFWGVGVLGVVAIFLLPRGFYWNLTRPIFHKTVINKYAGEYKMDPLFVMALVRVESRFQKDARSPRGAVGLMQLMPDTAREMAQRLGLNNVNDRWEEPELNIRLGIHYLFLLNNEFPDDMVGVLAAYNAGPSVARTWREFPPLKLSDIRYPETRAFVTKVMRTYRWLKILQRFK